MNTIIRKDYLTIHDVQDCLQISKSQAYALCRRNDFPVCRFGGSIRVPRELFEQWVLRHTRIPSDLAA